MKIHTVLIHQAFAAKDEPGGTRHYELGQRLVADGQQFTVVASDVSYTTGKSLVPKKRLVTESKQDGIRILRAFTLSALHKSYLSRVLLFLSFMATSVLVGARAGRVDVVMGTTPPIFQAISAWFLAALRRKPFLLEVRDLWPEFAIDIGLLKNPLLIWIARRVESFLYRHADHLLVNSPAYREYLIEKGIDPGKITFIANGVDPAMFDPGERADDFRRQLGLESKFVVTYAGAIGMANDIDVLIDAAALIQHRSDIQILIVGDGKERKRLEEHAKQLGLDNVLFTGAFPKSQMNQVLAASDACVAILRNIRMFRTTYPNKVFDYMAAGRPTILAIDGVIRQVIEAAEGGIFVPPGDAGLLSAAIVNLADSPERARAMGTKARAYVIEHFDRNVHARQFTSLISSVAARNRPNELDAAERPIGNDWSETRRQ
jgi:glycosyltransferase involved in cell wall biosynthesis